MKHSIRLSSLLAFASMGLLLPPASHPYSGVVEVDSVSSTPGGQLTIPIRLSGNDTPLSGMIIPLRFDSPLLTVDSVSPAGSLLPAGFTYYALVDNTARRVTVTYLAQLIDPIPSFETAEGLIATIHASISGLATPGMTFAIDSVNSDTVATDGGPAAHLWERIHACGPTGIGTVQPGFVWGQVSVKASTAVDDRPAQLPASFDLSQNYPNPFNPATTIEFMVPQSSRVRLEVFNILGQRVVTLVDSRLQAGRHQASFDGGDLPSGVYFYRLTHAQGSLTRKMTLIK